MDTDMQVRFATPEDLPTLLAFEQGIVQWEIPMDPDLITEHEIHYYDLAEYIGRADTAVVVAEDESGLIGSSYGQIRSAKSFHRYERVGYIGFVFVREDRRGRGVVGRIFNELFEWFKGHEIRHLELTVYAKNPSAIRAYEKLGFDQRLIEMRMQLQ